MKTIELQDGFKLKVCETLEDINIKRFVAHKEWMIVKELGIDFVRVTDVYAKFLRAVDEKSISAAIIALTDHMRGLKYIQDREDANQMIFALISVVEGEDCSITDNTVMKEKLSMLAGKGLTQGMVNAEVENFRQASRDN